MHMYQGGYNLTVYELRTVTNALSDTINTYDEALKELDSNFTSWAKWFGMLLVTLFTIGIVRRYASYYKDRATIKSCINDFRKCCNKIAKILATVSLSNDNSYLPLEIREAAKF